MRLINVSTLALTEVNYGPVPPYAILSHRWTDGEVLYRTFLDERERRNFKGWIKIDHACRQAHADGLGFVWVDTCCIDKDSSAELSEAINSMFTWYQGAAVCYAYLEDVQLTLPNEPTQDLYGKLIELTVESGGGSLTQQLQQLAILQKLSSTAVNIISSSRWFSRGWTLQELLAPKRVEFFSTGWKHVGSKQGLAPLISSITRIDEPYLTGSRPVYTASLAKRMSWAADRQTTRVEDVAYCLMGLFDVNMPLLYGEGSKSFLRLQEEILRVSDDQSLFAWSNRAASEGSLCGLLAKHPNMFRESGEIEPLQDYDTEHGPTAMTNLGLSMNLNLVAAPWSTDSYIARLRCTGSRNSVVGVGIMLQKLAARGRLYARAQQGKLFVEPREGPLTQVYVRQSTGVSEPTEYNPKPEDLAAAVPTEYEPANTEPSLEIASAHFGGKEYTTYAKILFNDGKNLKVDSHEPGFPDPWYGVHKSLSFIYTLGDERRLFVCRDDTGEHRLVVGPITMSQNGRAEIVEVRPRPMPSRSNIEILAIVWGGREVHNAQVDAYCYGQFQNGEGIAWQNETMGGDTWPMYQKSGAVYFVRNGSNLIESTSGREGTTSSSA